MESVHRPAHADDTSDRDTPDGLPFTTAVEPSPDGRWLAVVNLGDGASATKVCDDQAEAARYGEELLRWLGRRQPE
jgi:hypothetical protein